MSHLRVESSIDFDEWDDFVDRSKQGTVFNTSSFLMSSGCQPNIYYVKKGNECLAGIAITTRKDSAIEPFSLAQYFNSVLFAPIRHSTQYKRQILEFESSEVLIRAVLEEYGEFHAIHTPFYRDVRAFLWHNYHEQNKGVFNIDVLYTAILNLHRDDNEDLYSAISTRRRRDLRKFSNEITIEESQDIDLLDSLHCMTFERQGLVLLDEERELLRSVASGALHLGFGNLTVAFVNGDPASAALFLADSKTYYYLIGANNPDYRYTGVSTQLMWHNIQYALEKGFSFLDFVGANSPRRGDYKLSFNSVLHPYFECHLKNHNTV
jgi:Acetyltransferase (GNAT) domain